MNLPNKLTISRIILTFVFMFFLFSKGLVFRYLALFTFAAAALTDYYDGKIAREKNMITDFGKFFDPIADKILILGAFLAFVELKLVPAWIVVLIATREIIITGLRIFATTQGRVIAADLGGKHKTISQVVAIFVILIFMCVKETFGKYSSANGELERWFLDAIMLLMLITVALTLISGVSYLIRNKDLILSEKRN